MEVAEPLVHGGSAMSKSLPPSPPALSSIGTERSEYLQAKLDSFASKHFVPLMDEEGVALLLDLIQEERRWLSPVPPPKR